MSERSTFSVQLMAVATMRKSSKQLTKMKTVFLDRIAKSSGLKVDLIEGKNLSLYRIYYNRIKISRLFFKFYKKELKQSE